MHFIAHKIYPQLIVETRFWGIVQSIQFKKNLRIINSMYLWN